MKWAFAFRSFDSTTDGSVEGPIMRKWKCRETVFPQKNDYLLKTNNSMFHFSDSSVGLFSSLLAAATFHWNSVNCSSKLHSEIQAVRSISYWSPNFYASHSSGKNNFM